METIDNPALLSTPEDGTPVARWRYRVVSLLLLAIRVQYRILLLPVLLLLGCVYYPLLAARYISGLLASGAFDRYQTYRTGDGEGVPST